ncbi:LysE family translocator [Aliiroseovarius sp. M344]|uniref:LysE family translocator n=1 Tax=Aliiroseovarius sp. M344 TaxID=2867010 RepID=UPI0021AD9186|nr:LysE family translocator [Aliiroseovarius sp. M344]UWQ14684.1 LysE family translocator [Aliiroseovarius sp. M344]
MTSATLIAVLVGWIVAGGSPGPATLAISGTSMEQGRIAGLSLAFGILAGSAMWGIAAAFGFSALMLAHSWMFEVVRYAGAAYLLYLALKSLKSAWQPKPLAASQAANGHVFFKGFLIHLTNPKAVLAWGSIYAIALPASPEPVQIWNLFALLIIASALVFLGYAVLFSNPAIAFGYRRAKRGFDLVFGLLFGAASAKILTAKLEV